MMWYHVILILVGVANTWIPSINSVSISINNLFFEIISELSIILKTADFEANEDEIYELDENFMDEVDEFIQYNV